MAKSRAKIWVLAGVIGVPLFVLVASLATLDVNSFRSLLAEQLSSCLDRKLTLAGPIKLGFSFDQGLELSVSDASLDNPSWASRAQLAKMGRLDLAVDLLSLLRHRLDVRGLALSDVDVLLEQSPRGVKNWELAILKAKKNDEMPAPGPLPSAAGKPMLTLHVRNIRIAKSRFGLRGKDGKVSYVNVQELTLETSDTNLHLRFTGDQDGAPIQLDVQGADLERIKETKWPFVAEASLGVLRWQGQGFWLNATQEIALDHYDLKAGDSRVSGQMVIKLGGVRPAIIGSIKGDKIAVGDFRLPAKSELALAQPQVATQASVGVFSRVPLPLDGLKAIDAKLDIALESIALGPALLQDLKTRLDLSNGRLVLAPFSAVLGGSKLEGVLKLDASLRPALMNVAMKVFQIDLAQMVRLGGLESFVAGKGDMDTELASSGISAHDFASHVNGRFNLVVAGGTFSQQALAQAANNLLDIFAPGTGQLLNPELNCMAARFTILDGKAQTNGVLIDTAQATMAATGEVDLGAEKVNLLVHSRAKGTSLGTLAPPLRIRGALAKPQFELDAVGSVSRVAGALLGGALGADEAVPDVVEQAGQNACVYTLEHPSAAKAMPTQGNVVQNAVGKAQEKIKNVGAGLLQNLGGKLFGK